MEHHNRIIKHKLIKEIDIKHSALFIDTFLKKVNIFLLNNDQLMSTRKISLSTRIKNKNSFKKAEVMSHLLRQRQFCEKESSLSRSNFDKTLMDCRNFIPNNKGSTGYTNPTMQSSNCRKKDIFSLYSLNATQKKKSSDRKFFGKNYTIYEKKSKKKNQKRHSQTQTVSKQKIEATKKSKERKSVQKSRTKMSKKSSQIPKKQSFKGKLFKDQNLNYENKKFQYTQTNKQLLSRAQNSFNPHKMQISLILTKISNIFDLIIDQAQLPFEVQILFGKAIKNLRAVWKYQRTQIPELLKIFKNECLHLYENASKSDIQSFNNCEIPNKNRWKSTSSKRSSREIQLQNRSRYFSSLSRKTYISGNYDEENAFSRIQDKINNYLSHTKAGLR